MKKITLTLITLFGLSVNAQTTIVDENFDLIQNNALPTGWNFISTSNVIGTDDYYTACNGTLYLYANIYELETTEVTTPAYSGLNTGALTISYNLMILDYNTEAPVVGNFGAMEMLYSIDNGTTWVTLGTINSTTFTPSNTCQLITYTIPSGTTSSTSNLKVKLDFTYNTGDWEVILDDFKIVQEVAGSTPSLDLANLSVYPNPVSDRLNIDYKENISNLTVYDLSGRSVKSFTSNNRNNSIDVSDLKSGIYMLRIETENNNVSTVKFIKK